MDVTDFAIAAVVVTCLAIAVMLRAASRQRRR